jgi:hypothetical protein
MVSGWEPAHGSSIPTHEQATVSEDGLRVRLFVTGLREHFVQKLEASGVRSLAGEPLLHPRAYYTLNRIPTE